MSTRQVWTTVEASGNIYVIVISNRIGSWSRLPFQYGVGAAEEGTN